MLNFDIPENDKLAAFKQILRDYPGNSAAQQRARALAVLQRGLSFNTNEARTLLAVYWAPTRIFELRALGYNIVTFWQKITLATGQTHRVARYAMQTAVAGVQP